MISHGWMSKVCRWARRAVIAGVAAGGSMGLVGCSSDLQQRADLLEQENMDLRAANDQLSTALRDAETRADAASRDASALRGEAERLRSASNRPTGGSTGFEGLTGVTTSMRGGELVVDVAGDVLFDSGKATLKSSAKQTLDRIAEVLNSSYSGRGVRIAGHTDTDPIKKSGWKSNERLSAERALAVEEYLASRGVSQNRMYAAAYGPSQPKGSKKDSRRVEIVIIASAGN